MDFKKKMKNFFTLTRKANGGFTLVELIVVIAILAILAGVGVPVYSGYITKANKQADMALASEVAHALTLRYYAEGGDKASAVIITTSGAKANDDFATKAMEAAFGKDWANTVALKYDGWGAGNYMSATILEHFSENSTDGALAGIYSGELSPTFSNDVDDLFVLMKDVANLVGNGEGSELVKGAAGITTDKIKANEFANYWKDTAWNSDYFMGDGKGATYNENVNKETGETLNNAIANAAVIKARNTALANYLKNQYPGDSDIAEVCNMIENYTMGSSNIIPADFVGTLLTGGDENDTKFVAIDEKIGELGEDKAESFVAYIESYYDDSNGQSLAEIDGLAYYAMMDTVHTTASDPALNGASEEEYWDAMSGAVNLYGTIARNESELEDLKNALAGAEEGSVSIVFYPANGECKIYPSVE